MRDDAVGTFDHRGAEFDIARRVQRAAQPAGLPGADPGRRLRRGPGAGREARRRHLQPALRLRRRAGVLRRRQAPPGRVRPPAGRAARSCPRPRPSSATPTPTPRSTPRRSGSSRSARRARSRSSSRCGAATCRRTTPTGPLPDVDPDVGRRADHPGPGAPREGPARGRGEVAGASPRRRTSASAS